MKHHKRKHRQLSLDYSIDSKRLDKVRNKRNKISYPKYWIFTPSDNGVTGWFNDSESAYRYGNANFDIPFRVVPLNTVDRAKASAILRAKKMPLQRIKYSQASRTRMKHRKINHEGENYGS